MAQRRKHKFAGVAPTETLPTVDPLRRYDFQTGCALLDISRARAYQKVSAGELAVIRDGRRTYIPGSEIVRLSTLGA